MSKTISVREAAVALGLTPRAVTYRLEKQQLKGTLTKNDSGVPEWRIYPNKEIMAGLSQNAPTDNAIPIDFEPTDFVDAEAVDGSEESNQTAARQQDNGFNSESFQALIEQFVRPLVEEVKAQTLAIAERDRIIEEQSRQLRLLPDLQKRAEEEKAHADQERKVANERALEVIALNTQVGLMEQEKSKTVEQLETIEEEKKKLEAKANEAMALAADLSALKQTVEKLQAPWWKKILGV
ncbi:hypothetical protein BH11CYA1_BH11CYA1_50830 [soil metagenome]